MRLTAWEKFRRRDDVAPSTATVLWRRIRWPVGKQPVSAFSETADAFIARTRIRGLGAGDVMLSLEDGALVIQGEVQQANPHATFKGTYSCRFVLPANVDVKGMSLVRKGDVVTVQIPKLGAGRGD